MIIKMNLKGNFKLVPEGERVLEITSAELKPRDIPNKMIIKYKDSDGGTMQSTYNFDNEIQVKSMSYVVSAAFNLQDGDDFDTRRVNELVGKKLLCEVVHSEGKTVGNDGKLPVFANIKRVISLVNDDTGEVIDSPRNAIAEKEDFDDLN